MPNNNKHKIDKQDLNSAKLALKEFRHDIAVLKKFKLIDSSYDARSVKPSKYLKGLVKEFGDVLKGRAKPVKVSKENASYYKKRGYRVKNGRVVVPHAENESVRTSHGNFVVTTQGKGGKIHKIDLGFSTRTIANWRKKLQDKKFKLKKGERIGFSFHGNYSEQLFEDINDLLDFLEYYDEFTKAEESGSINYEKSVIDGIVFYRVERDAKMPATPIDEEKKKWRRKRQAEKREAWLGRMTPERREEYNRERANSRKQSRENMTPEQKENYKEKARARAKKSYAERSKQNSGSNGKRK